MKKMIGLAVLSAAVTLMSDTNTAQADHRGRTRNYGFSIFSSPYGAGFGLSYGRRIRTPGLYSGLGGYAPVYPRYYSVPRRMYPAYAPTFGGFRSYRFRGRGCY